MTKFATSRDASKIYYRIMIWTIIEMHVKNSNESCIGGTYTKNYDAGINVHD